MTVTLEDMTHTISAFSVSLFFPFSLDLILYGVDEKDSDHPMDLRLGKLPQEASFPEKLDHISLHQFPLGAAAAGRCMIG